VFEPVIGHVHPSRDVVFNEAASWDWHASEGSSATPATEFTVEYQAKVTQPGSQASGESPPRSELVSPTPAGTPPVGTHDASRTPTFVSPPGGGSENVDNDHDDCPQRGSASWTKFSVSAILPVQSCVSLWRASCTCRC
jgi:hypothetical protein